MILRNKKYTYLILFIGFISILLMFIVFTNNDINLTEVLIKEKVINVQKVKKNEKVTVSFEIVNKGDKELIISNVVPSCHCTVPTWKKEPIQKGKSFIVDVEYEDYNTGYFQEDVMIYCNIENSPILLTLEGERVPFF